MSYIYPDLVDYPFFGDPEDSKIVSLYCADVIRGGADQLRNEMGNYWLKATPETGNPTIDYNMLSVETDIADLRGQIVSRMVTDSEFIEKVEFNPYMITNISNDVYVPNYRIPMRLYASEAASRGDKFWQVLFKGGTWAGQTYKSIIDDKSIFYDEAFSFEIPYSVMESKMTEPISEAEKIYKAKPYYVYYNHNVAKYQNWSDKLESELLMPFWYLYTSVFDHAQWLETEYSIAELTAAGHLSLSLGREQRVFLEQNECFFEYFRPGIIAALNILDSDYDDTSYDDLSAEEISELNDVTAGTINSVPIHSSRGINEKLIALNIDHFEELPTTTRNKVIERCKNVIFPHEYYNVGPSDYEDNLEQTFPFYNKISFPRTKEDSDATEVSLIETISKEYTVRNSIADNNFSAKFLETLKDIHNGEFATTRFGIKTFISEKNYYSGSTMYGGTGPEIYNDLGHTRLRALDLTYMISEIYNQHGSSINYDYYIAGRARETYEATYTDTDLYRFQDNQNALEVLKDISGMLQSYMNIAGPTAHGMSLPSTPLYPGGPIRPDDPIAMDELLEAFLNPSYKHTEVLAYRVEKKRANRNVNQTSRETIQNFWIFNSEDAGRMINIYDTQVKYDQDYTYVGYAYMLVLGHRYRYGDYRLTKQIGTIDVGPGASPFTPSDGDPEYYCLQFYDPKTEQFADQIFFDGTGDDTDSPYADALTSLLATGASSLPGAANPFATDRQEVSPHPHLADCHLYIEPCLKLVEIPIFSKTFKTLDNPANDMITIPFQYINNSHMVGFNTIYESFMEETYPQVVTEADRKIRSDYLHAQDLLPHNDVVLRSESPPRFVQIFRLDKPPTSISDFADNLRDTADLRIEDSQYTYSQAVLNDKLMPNKKYYYLFRFLNENKMPGHLSQILECELIDDGGYIYSTFNTLADSDMKKESYSNPSTTFKKILQLQPHVSQLTLDTSEVNFSAPAGTQLTELKIGVTDEQLWNKTFKLRLTSKKTGKQLDLNVTYKLKSEDKFNPELL